MKKLNKMKNQGWKTHQLISLIQNHFQAISTDDDEKKNHKTYLPD